jgi:hypothetical protein
MLNHDVGTSNKIYTQIYRDTITEIHSKVGNSGTTGKSFIESILRKVDKYFDDEVFTDWWYQEKKNIDEESYKEIDPKIIKQFLEDPSSLSENTKELIRKNARIRLWNNNVDYSHETRLFISSVCNLYKDLSGNQFNFESQLLQELVESELDSDTSSSLDKVKNPQMIMFLYLVAKKEDYNFTDSKLRNLFAEEVYRIYRGEKLSDEGNPRSKYYDHLSDFMKRKGGIGKESIKGYLRPSSVFELADKPHINYSNLTNKLYAINSLLPEHLTIESEIEKLEQEKKVFLSDIDSNNKLSQ